MYGVEDRENERLADEIRKQFGSPASQRYHQSLPWFEVDQRLPDRFGHLLGQLDEAWRRRRSSKG